MRNFPIALFSLALCASATEAQVIYSSTGTTAADVTPTVNAFRTDLGALNPNVAGSFDTGRREINWDGVPDARSAPNLLPADFFNVNSPRGVVMSTPGTGFEVSANAVNPTSTPIEFGNIDPSYSDLFSAFSAQRIFTATGSNILDVDFFVPGTTTPAFVAGFGSIFTDVDLADTTTLTFFGVGGTALGTWSVPSTTGDETFSFLGVLFSDPIIGSVRITSGNTALAPGISETGAIDLVAMDDFIFGEPQAVPEPATWLLMLTGFAAIALRLRRRRSGNARTMRIPRSAGRMTFARSAIR